VKKPGLTGQIFIGLILGILVGWLFPEAGKAVKPLADVFLHLIKSIIAPLIFSTLVVGIAGHKSMKSLGRLGLKSIIYFEVITTLALAVGLFSANYFQPGAGVNLAALAPPGSELTAAGAARPSAPSTSAAGSHLDAGALASRQPGLAEIIVHTVPESIVDAMARGDVLQIVVFSILFAAAVRAAKAELILRICNSLAEVMFKYTNFVMKFAPVGVAAAMAATVAENGINVLRSLFQLIATLYFALFVFIFLVLLPVALLARVPLAKFIRAAKEPVLLAFTTSSSEAALPKAMQSMEALGVPRNIVSFVIPVGYTFNLDGTTLYLSLAAPFVAQAAGIHMPLQTQIVMMLTLMLTSKGVAAVSRAALVILAGTLASFNLPLAGVAVVLGVDAILDMGRTSVNVLGNCLASVVMARWEGVFDDNAGGVVENEKTDESDPELVSS
jgi:proton glutamate symport protein